MLPIEPPARALHARIIEAAVAGCYYRAIWPTKTAEGLIVAG
jgi:hypothetical protein